MLQKHILHDLDSTNFDDFFTKLPRTVALSKKKYLIFFDFFEIFHFLEFRKNNSRFKILVCWGYFYQFSVFWYTPVSKVTTKSSQWQSSQKESNQTMVEQNHGGTNRSRANGYRPKLYYKNYRIQQFLIIAIYITKNSFYHGVAMIYWYIPTDLATITN